MTCLVLPSPARGANETVTVIVDGEELITDVPAQVLDERTMVPFRALLEKLGATVYWTEGSDSFSAIKGDTVIEMTIDNPSAYVNHVEYTLDVPPTVIDNRTLIPVRFVSEALEYEVIWSAENYTAYINSPAALPSDEAPGASVLAHLMAGATIDPVYAAVPDVLLIALPHSYYTIRSSSMTQGHLEDTLKALGIFDNLASSEEIKLINPVEKIKVGADWIIPEIAELDDGLANDPGYSSQWALAWTNANRLWGIAKQKRPIIVAVVDTGVDYNHPDLQGRVLYTNGYDFVNNDPDPMDDNGHGTHCAGIIAAQTNNYLGIAGIAGELSIAVLPVKVMDSAGSGRSDDIASGIIWAANHGANIINLSIGTQGESEDISAAVEYASSQGALIVAAAGNDNSDADLCTPASDPGVFTVAATNPLNTRAVFSNTGNCIEIAAPGVRILSTVPGAGYEAWSGTSMAAPVVSGIAAVLMACNEQMGAVEVMALINSTALDIGSHGYDEKTGNGLIDAWEAHDQGPY